jgi:DNA-binding response OmpR family regulator
MRVSCLLVTRDPDVEQIIADVFAGIDLRLRDDALSALDLIGRGHFDGFVVDCDGVERGHEVVMGIRRSRSNRNSTVFTIVDRTTSFENATVLGSNYVLSKPIEQRRLQRYLHSAIRKMELEHRRYFRYQIILDAIIIFRDGKLIPAQILNVSEGGLALRLLDQADIQGTTTVRFTIPGLENITITATAALRWCNEPMLGVQLVDMDEESRSAYQKWLGSMDLV